VLVAAPLLDGICEDGLFLLCEDDLLRAMFEKELPMINIVTTVKVTTTPNKIFAFVFDKMVYVITTDLIMITDGRLSNNMIVC
jgi:hypothetical protein